MISEGLLKSNSLAEFDFELKKICKSNTHFKTVCLFHLSFQPHYFFYPASRTVVDTPVYIDSAESEKFTENILSYDISNRGELPSIPLPKALADYFSCSETKFHSFTIKTGDQTLATLILIPTSQSLQHLEKKLFENLAESLAPILTNLELKNKSQIQQEAKKDLVSWLEIENTPNGFGSEKQIKKFIDWLKDKVPSDEINLFTQFDKNQNLDQENISGPTYPHWIDLDRTKNNQNKPKILNHPIEETFKIGLLQDPFNQQTNNKLGEHLNYFLDFSLQFNRSDLKYTLEFCRSLNRGGFYDYEILYLETILSLLKLISLRPIGNIPSGTIYSNDSTSIPRQQSQWNSIDSFQTFHTIKSQSFQINLSQPSVDDKPYRHYYLELNSQNTSEMNFHLQKLAEHFFTNFSKQEEFLKNLKMFTDTYSTSDFIEDFFLFDLQLLKSNIQFTFLTHQFDILHYDFELGKIKRYHYSGKKEKKEKQEKSEITVHQIDLKENDLVFVTPSSVVKQIKLKDLEKEIALMTFLETKEISEKVKPKFFNHPDFFELIKITTK